MSWGARLLVGSISAYQHTISPDHGWLARWRSEAFCGHVPTCSEYAQEALVRHGAAVGLRLTFRRLRKCGRNLPSFDPVPDALAR